MEDAPGTAHLSTGMYGQDAHGGGKERNAKKGLAGNGRAFLLCVVCRRRLRTAPRLG